MPCSRLAYAIPLPCLAFIHTSHAAPLPCSDSAVSFVKVRVVAGNIRTASLTDRPFCSVLLPLFTIVGMIRCEEDWYACDNNLRGTPRGSRKKPNAGRQPTGRLSTAVLCRGLEKNGIVRVWHGRGMASVNQARPHCVIQMGKTHSKPLSARHAMCESAFKNLWLRRM
jgi:hypothetical protein